MARMTYTEYRDLSESVLNNIRFTKEFIKNFVEIVKAYQRLNGHNLYARGVVNVVESYANWLCDYTLLLYREFTSDLYDAQKRHTQRLINKEFTNADTDK